MKFPLAAIFSFLAGSSSAQPAPLETNDSIGMRVTKVGNVPTSTTDAFSYNMGVSEDPKNGRVFFMDQKFGKIFVYTAKNGRVDKVWDLENDAIPDGLDLSYDYVPGFDIKVQRVHPGKKKNEVIVIFTSLTLPDGWKKPSASLPAPGAYPAYLCNGEEFIHDAYRIGTMGECVFSQHVGLPTYTVYQVFYKFKLQNKKLSNPYPFFVIENQMAVGHQGGGSTVLDNGSILWSVGDCTIYGYDGLYAPQDDKESCGKILLIDTMKKNSYEVVAKGVRNSQQMKIVKGSKKKGKKHGWKGRDLKGSKGKSSKVSKGKSGEGYDERDFLVFADIGAVTAEEVNAVYVKDLLDTNHIENFGWGRNTHDGKAREGTFYIEQGGGGLLPGEPPFKGDAPVPEGGYMQPWVQFGRTATDFFFAIAGFAVSDVSFDKLKLVWTEFNTGLIMGTTKKYSFKNYSGPVKGYKIKLFNKAGKYLENGLNDLVAEELGGDAERGDGRMFHYPDGTAGVFIERTGAFYKLEEIDISDN